MSLAQRVIARPVTWLVVFALVVGLGLYMLTLLPVDQFPEIEPPIIMVSCDYGEVPPATVEWNVTRVLEGALANVTGVEEMTSTSSKGSSMIVLSFAWGKDLTEATNDVRDNLERIRDYLPAEAGSPTIFKFNPSSMPILRLAVRGDRSPEELYHLADQTIQSRLERIEGVATTALQGGREKVVRVEVPLDRLEAYGLSLTGIASALAAQNSEGSGGEVREGSRELTVITAGDFQNLEDIANTVVSYRNEEAVALRDLTEVRWGYADADSLVYVNGEPGVYISVMKQSGSNSIAVADKVQGQLRKINKLLPAGVELRVVMDTTTMVRASMSSVLSSVWQGIALTVLVLLPFLRRVRTTLIVVISIPVSILATIIGMYFLHISFNMVSLTGIILAMGMVVDASIVILENIQHYREKGSKLATAAVLGTREMIVAISASTLTTVAVFLPLVLFQNRLDMIGQIVRDLSFTVVIALLVSLAVAIILVPVLATYVFPVYTSRQRPLRSRFFKALDGFLGGAMQWLQAGYRRAVAFVLRFRWLTVFAALAALAGAVSLVPRVGFQFTPPGQDDSVELEVSLPPGTPLENTLEVVRRLEEVARSELQGYTNLVSTAGGGSGFFGSTSTTSGSLAITLDLKAKGDDSWSAQRKLRKHYGEFPDAAFSISSFRGFGSSSGVEVSIYCDDLDRALEAADSIRSLIRKNLPLVSEVGVDIDSGLPQLEVAVDRRKAFDLGVSMSSVSAEIEAAMAGATATVYRYGGEEYDVLVILAETDRSDLPDLERIFTLTSTGQRVPLASFADLQKSTGPVDIKRENQKRVVHVSGSLPPGAKANQVEASLRNLIDSNVVQDEELSIELTGSMSDLGEAGGGLAVIAVMALILVFGVMAAQFQSFKDPFIILLASPLLVIGVILMYVWTGEPFSIFSGIGVVVLIGIVVNNGIVLVDYTNLLRARGMKVREACIEAAGNRLRPILMTSLTTILAMVPMAFFPGAGSEQIKPIGVTVTGGLLTSTFITLFLVPVLYSLFNERRRKAKGGSK
jgi:HAE1 family hydrophobic/amphiphilic exporter-1